MPDDGGATVSNFLSNRSFVHGGRIGNFLHWQKQSAWRVGQDWHVNVVASLDYRTPESLLLL